MNPFPSYSAVTVIGDHERAGQCGQTLSGNTEANLVRMDDGAEVTIPNANLRLL